MPLLRMYAITAIVLGFKMFTNSIVQGRGRFGAKVFPNPEDAKLFGGQLAAQEVPTVQRASAVWRNDVENIAFFLILAGIYVMAAGLSSAAFEIYCVVFVIARIFHSIFYLNGVQPWRTIAFTIGAAATFAIMIHLLIEVVLV
jgi:glutathione S-transferase